jgi:ribonuclease T2
VVDYFRVAVDLFKTLPTYQVRDVLSLTGSILTDLYPQWLADAGIVPSTSQIYKLEDIQAALKKPRGFSAVIGCQGTELREVWYFYNVRGSLQGGRFVPSEPNFSGVGGSPGKSCPQTVRYLPKYVYEPVTR